MTRLRNAKLPTWNMLWILLFGVVFGIFLCAMPKMSDDLAYSGCLKPWMDAQGVRNLDDGGNIFTHGIPADEILTEWRDVYPETNWRFSNVLALPLLLFPKWFGSALMTLLLVWSVILAFRCTDIDWKRSWLVAPALFAWTFFLPWSDHFGSLDFQINYILPTALALCLLNRLMAERRNHVSNRLNLILVTLIAFLLGITHEGFAFPFLAGLVAMAIFFKEWRKPSVYLSMAMLCIGVVWLFAAPGMRERTNASVDIENFLAFDTIYYTFLREFIPFACVSLCAAVVFATRLRRRLSGADKEVLIFLLISGMVAILIGIMVETPSRGYFWTDLCCVLALLVILKAFAHKRSGYSWTTGFASGLLLLIVFIHMGAVDIYAFKYRADFRKVCETFEKSPGTYAFSTDTDLENIPLICGMRPDRDYNKGALVYMPLYTGVLTNLPDGSRNKPWIVPASLKAASANAGREMADSRVRELNGQLFVPWQVAWDTGLLDSRTIAYIPRSHYREMPVELVEFVSPADGKRYVWIFPLTDWLPYRLKFRRSVKRGEIWLTMPSD